MVASMSLDADEVAGAGPPALYHHPPQMVELGMDTVRNLISFCIAWGWIW
jgi:hypothetical protein